jgi:hypothetical protein
MIFSLDALISVSIMLTLTATGMTAVVPMMKKVQTRGEMKQLAAAVRMYEYAEGELPNQLSDLDLPDASLTDAWGDDYDYDDGDREICSDNMNNCEEF